MWGEDRKAEGEEKEGPPARAPYLVGYGGTAEHVLAGGGTVCAGCRTVPGEQAHDAPRVSPEKSPTTLPERTLTCHSGI